MRTIYTLLIIVICSLSLPALAQHVQFSANTRAFQLRVDELSSRKSSQAAMVSVLSQFYPVKTINNQNYIGALIRVFPGMDRTALENLGVKINTRAGNIWSVMIPLSSMEELNGIRGLDFVELDALIRPKLDNATAESRVKLVQAGTGLKQKYFGDSVVIGIVDEGFDYTHPAFYDTTGTRLRILRAWEQGNDQGPAPSGFSYGTEITGPDALLAKQTSDPESHGTHVAGIASGSGFLTPGDQYRGVAPDADLVLVRVGDAASAVTDGINYVFQQAAAAGKPAVVNLSLGSHIGPHDGTSLMDQAIDNLVGPGKIVAGAAGNEGGTPLHIYHAFNSDTIRTAVFFENRDAVYNLGQIEHWGSANSDFSIALNVLDAGLNVIATTPFYTASDNPGIDTLELLGDDTLQYSVTGVGSSALNQKPNLLVVVKIVKKGYIVVLNVTSTNSQVNIWNHGRGIGAAFVGDPQLGYIAGDTKCTVGEIGGTSKKIITVGAYTTKYTFQNIKGETMTSTDSLDRIANFSSRGPTADGRTKPEITAPGEQLVSSVNSFDPSYDENNSQVVMKVEDGSSRWFFAAMQGTSMATPLTTGVIALMLQADPNLGPEQVKQILQESARTDTYTGIISPGGSNTWGWGKIDAQKAVLAASGNSGIVLLGNTEFLVYPNPARGLVFLKNNGSGSLSAHISMRNSHGVIVKEDYNQWNAGSIYPLDLSAFPAGMYVITLTGSNGLKSSQKLQLIR